MSDPVKEMQEIARGLLESGSVAMVIGYTEGSLPGITRPIFIEKPEDAGKLVWNESCVNNLTRYLPELKNLGKLAVVVKGCDAKSAVGLIQENQIAREQVHLVGMECFGTKDREGKLLDKCAGCQVTTPPLYDDLIKAEGSAAPAPDEVLVDRLEKMSLEERAAFWEARFSDCIRCYACRQVCPLCYCNECFTDKRPVRWLSKEVDPAENWMFHLTRAMHLAGRCIGCGECVRVCPMNLPLGALAKKLNREVQALFDYVPGLDPEVPMPLATFTMGDPELAPEGSK